MSEVQYDAALAESYSSNKRFEHPIGRMNYETWLRVLGDVNAKTALDLACGSGYSSRLLAQRGAHVIGVDVSEEMITLAKAEEDRRPLGIEYLVADAKEMQLNRTFDTVTPSYLLHYAADLETLTAFAETIAAHLRTGGRMVALHANANPIVPRMENGQHSTEWAPGEEPWREGAKILLHLYDLQGNDVLSKPIEFYYWQPDTYERALESAGLSQVTWHKIEMSGEAKVMFPNWPELDTYNTSCILSAVKQ